MKKIFAAACSFIFMLSLAACNSNVENQPSMDSTTTTIAPDTKTSGQPNNDRQIQITTEGGNVIVFALNNSTAAKELYAQLPMSVEVENFSNNEKIFYPPEKLDTGDAPLAKGPAGTLAYYEPWGNVAIYYGDCGGAAGLYELGDIISGVNYISEITGEIKIDAVGKSSVPSETADSENSTAASQQTQPHAASQTPSSASQSVSQQTRPPKGSQLPSSEAATSPSQTPSSRPTDQTNSEESAVTKMNIQVGNLTFTATLADNSAVDSFVAMMKKAPVVINMRDYAGFEKVGSLETSLPTSNRQTTTQSGDIVLYNGNQIVIFYGSNSWSYTQLGRIDDLSGWEEALGSRNVTVTFSVK